MSLIPVVHTFNLSSREDDKTGGQRSQAQSHSELSGGKIVIFRLRLRQEPLAGCVVLGLSG